MAANFSRPINTTDYATVWDFVRDNIDLVATWFEDTTGASDIPTNAKAFSITNKRFEYWSGSAWLELLSKATTAYDIRAAVADLADLATTATTAGACTGNAATASLATNSLQLGGVVASSYTLNTDIRAITYGGTGSNTQAGARTNLDVYSKAESDNRYLNESNNLSDLDSASTARTNLDVDSKSEAAVKYKSASNGAGYLQATSTGTRTVTLGYQPSAVMILNAGGGGFAYPVVPTIISTGFTFSALNGAIYSWVALR